MKSREYPINQLAPFRRIVIRMKRIAHSHSCLVTVVLAIFLLTATKNHAYGQHPHKDGVQTERFVLIDLAEGKIVPNRHLVIFTGQSDKDARRHKNKIECDTDSNGVITLSLSPKIRWFQVWHEVGKVCPGGVKNGAVFHSSVLFDEGVLVMDACTPNAERLQPFVEPRPVIHMPVQ